MSLLAGCGSLGDGIDVDTIGGAEVHTPAWHADSLRGKIEGKWAGERKACATGPTRITFSSDGAVMFIEPGSGSALGRPEVAKTKYTYLVLDEGVRHLRTVREGEGQRTEGGHVVMWDLFLLADRQFCWHRVDWASGCTEPLVRCE